MYKTKFWLVLMIALLLLLSQYASQQSNAQSSRLNFSRSAEESWNLYYTFYTGSHPKRVFQSFLNSTNTAEVSTNYISNCNGGYTSVEPNLRIFWHHDQESDISDPQYLTFVYNTDDIDATLIVNTPNQRWFCNDDNYQYQPAIQISNPVSGQYDIWIGQFDSRERDISGTFYVTVSSLNDISLRNIEDIRREDVNQNTTQGVRTAMGNNSPEPPYNGFNTKASNQTQPNFSIVYDFVANANLATWSSGHGIMEYGRMTGQEQSLPFNGADNDARGFVTWRRNYPIENGTSPSFTLETHPAWGEVNGWINGTYFLPAPLQYGDYLQGQVGFIQGANAGNVTFLVVIEDNVVVAQVNDEGKDGLIRNVRIDFDSIPNLGSRNIRQVELRVLAGETSAQDWATWINLALYRENIPPTNTPRPTPRPTRIPTQPSIPSISCPGAYGPSFYIGARGYVPPGDGPTHLYNEPNSIPEVGEMPEYMQFTVMEGPVCVRGQSGNLISWRVCADNGQCGWASEGYPNSRIRWIAPLQ